MPVHQRRKIDPRDPRQLAVQVSLRMPFWYREQLEAEAIATHLSVPQLIMDTVQRAYPPK